MYVTVITKVTQLGSKSYKSPSQQLQSLQGMTTVADQEAVQCWI